MVPRALGAAAISAKNSPKKGAYIENQNASSYLSKIGSAYIESQKGVIILIEKLKCIILLLLDVFGGVNPWNMNREEGKDKK